MRNWLHLLLTLAAALLLAGTAWLLASQYTVTSGGQEPALYRGDRVLVTRTSYGLRLPLVSLWGYHRWGKGTPRKGEWIAFNQPAGIPNAIDRKPVCIARCTATPGDTVWLTWNQRVVTSHYPSSSIYPFVIPGWQHPVRVTPWNIRLLCNTLNRHEGRKAIIRDSVLWIDNRPTRTVRVRQDYYWVSSGRESDLNDSRYFGLIPETHLIGRARCVTYSTDPAQPLYRSFRADRFFISLP